MKILLIPLLLILFSMGCKKTVAEIDKLPPATQNGANTFGCLVNGMAFIPEKNCYLCSRALKFYYDITNGGEISINAYLEKDGINEFIGIGLDSINSKNIYEVSKDSLIMGCNYYNGNSSPECKRFMPGDSLVHTSGKLTISKFSLQTGIISGSFEFTLTKKGCETIKITNGRFDAKL